MLPIIVYHQIAAPVGDDRAPSDEIVALDRFAAQMRHLSEEGYRTLSMDEVVAFLDGESFGEKVVAIHFDDGWRSVLQATPILERYGHKATLWVIAGTGIGGAYLDWEEIVTLDRNAMFEVHSHTLSHPTPPHQQSMVHWVEGRVPGKGLQDARHELVESKRVLEARLGRPVPYLAWAGGHHNDALMDVARDAGYKALVTAWARPNRAGGDPFRIHRTMIDGSCGDEVFAALLKDGLPRSCSAQQAGPGY